MEDGVITPLWKASKYTSIFTGSCCRRLESSSLLPTSFLPLLLVSSLGLLCDPIQAYRLTLVFTCLSLFTFCPLLILPYGNTKFCLVLTRFCSLSIFYFVSCVFILHSISVFSQLCLTGNPLKLLKLFGTEAIHQAKKSLKFCQLLGSGDRVVAE